MTLPVSGGVPEPDVLKLAAEWRVRAQTSREIADGESLLDRMTLRDRAAMLEQCAAELEQRAALERPRPPQPDEFAWLIEDAVSKLGYYGGMCWTHEHLKAVRYSRREDAERAIMGLPYGWHLIGKAVEHGWQGLERPRPALPAPEPRRQK